MIFSFWINGQKVFFDHTQSDVKLIDYLHDEQHLTGTKLCCGIGICRACTVRVVRPPSTAEIPMLSCSTPLGLLKGAQVTTIEGIAPGEDQLDPVQEAFLSAFAFQCGYCAPGFVIASRIFLDDLKRRPLPAEKLEAALHDALDPHVCRCSGYVRYFEAVLSLARDSIAPANVETQ